MLLLFLELQFSCFAVTAVAFIWHQHTEYISCMCYVCATDQVSGGAWQYGGWAAQSCIQITGPVCPAQRAHAALLVSVLLQPSGSAHHPAAGVTCRNQPQKVCVQSLQTFTDLCVEISNLPLTWNLLFAWRFTTPGFKTLCVTLAGRQYGELVCQHWAPFLACFEWFCSWCRLKIWMRKSCPSSGRSCQCCCSMCRFTASCWPTPLCCKRSYNTSR